jgi:hypothetical protein
MEPRQTEQRDRRTHGTAQVLADQNSQVDAVRPD